MSTAFLAVPKGATPETTHVANFVGPMPDPRDTQTAANALRIGARDLGMPPESLQVLLVEHAPISEIADLDRAPFRVIRVVEDMAETLR